MLCALGAEPFGPWNSLVLEHLDHPLLVLYGGNASGKSALVELLAWTLGAEGAGEPGRGRFPWLDEPATERLYRNSARPGRVWIQWRFQDRQLRLLRRFDPRQPDGAGEAELQWLSPAPPDAHLARSWHELHARLAELTPEMLRRTFFLHEEELRRIHTRGGAAWEAAWYQVGAGVGRNQLARTQNHLRRTAQALCQPEQGGLLARLLRRRQELVDQLEQAASRAARFDLLHQRIHDLAEQIDALSRDYDRLAVQRQACRAAGQVLPLWQKQQDLHAQLEHLPGTSALSAPQVRRTALALKRLRQIRQRLGRLLKRRKELREQLRRCPKVPSPNVSWPQLLLVLQQQELLHTLEDQVRQARRRLLRWQQRYQEARNQAPVAVPQTGSPRLTREQIDQLAKLKRQRDHQQEVLSRLEAEYEKLLQRQQELEAVPVPKEPKPHPKQQRRRREELKRRAEALRRRIQLDHRIQETQQHLEFLEEQLDQLLEAQVLPRWMEIGFGVGFAVSGAFLLAGLLLPSAWTGGMGLLLFVLGLLGAAGSWGGKRFVQKKLAERLHHCQQELEDTRDELERLRQDEKRLPRELDPAQGPWELQLQKVKDELALLEPEADEPAPQSAAETAEELARIHRRLDKLQDQLENHTRRAEQLQADWEQACRRLGLPEDVDPQHLQPQLAAPPPPAVDAEAIKQHLEEAQAAYERARGRLQAWEDQVQRLAQGLGLSLSPGELGQQLAALQEQLQRYQQTQARRRRLTGQLRRLGRTAARLRARARRYRGWCDRMLVRLDLESLGQLQRLVRQAMQRLEVLEQIQRLDAQMASRCEGAPLELVKELLEHESPARLQQQEQELARQLAQLDQELEQLRAQQQQLHQQREELARDEQPARLQAELTALDYQLQQVAVRWASGALAWRLLRQACTGVEQQEKSPLLRQAEAFFRRLTRSRFVHLGACCDRAGLWVQDEQGNRWTPGQLSRATQDRLYLALRLAWCWQLRKRGVELPLVLDEVFLRQDPAHLEAAAELLRDLGRQGWQVIVLTAQPQVALALQDRGAELVSLDGALPQPVRTPSEAEAPPPSDESSRWQAELEQANRQLQQQAELLAEAQAHQVPPVLPETALPEPAPAPAEEPEEAGEPAETVAEEAETTPEPDSPLPEPAPEEPSPQAASDGDSNGGPEDASPPEAAASSSEEEPARTVALQRDWDAEEFTGELRDEVYHRLDDEHAG